MELQSPQILALRERGFSVASRPSMLDRILQQRALARWTTAAQAAEHADLNVLRDQLHQARQLRGKLNTLLHTAESRLGLPRIGTNAFIKPPGTRWSWRPPVWRGPITPKGAAGPASGAVIGPGMKLFHDCSVSELTLRQIRNAHEEDLAAFGLQMDVLGFDGTFLSVVIDFPAEAKNGLRKREIIQMQALIETERDTTVFARLNIKCGPNTEQIVQELPLQDANTVADFDLAYVDVVENRIEGMWLDLIFEEPAMNQLRIRDLSFCRYPRAEL